MHVDAVTGNAATQEKFSCFVIYCAMADPGMAEKGKADGSGSKKPKNAVVLFCRFVEVDLNSSQSNK